ncbi:hypothetical protein ACIJC2_003378 [Vibrio parahaemolyticus]|nr:hypothetical protein [Vibrio parahaemolyticus]
MSSSSNSGVEAGLGFSFQKCSAMCLLLDNFPQIGNRKYFIAFEHHDDFLYVFLNDDDHIEEVLAYQAKKKALSSSWGTDDKLAEIICKLTVTGQNILLDNSVTRSASYKHSLNFVTNAAINLHNGKRGKKKQSIKIDSSQDRIKFSILNDEIKNEIESKVISHKEQHELTQIKNIEFSYINLLNKHSENKNLLIGKMTTIFGASIVDYKAAVETLMTIFNDSELVYNLGGLPKLNDTAKWVAKSQIENTLDILTKEKKAYEFWRNHAADLCKQLKIPLKHKRNFKEHLNNCFDCFKSLENTEFKKILYFVRDNQHIDEDCYTEVSGIKALLDEINTSITINLESYIIPFAVIAAYVETRNIDV